MTNTFLHVIPAEGEEKPVMINLQRVHPLLPLTTALRAVSRRPVPPAFDVTRPDGIAGKEFNRSDPEYKEKMKTWRRSLTDDIARALLVAGVTESSRATIEERTPEELASISNAIERNSFPTEEGIQDVLATLSPLLVEGLLAAKFFNMQDPRDYIAMDVVMQNLLIAAFRHAQRLAQPATRAVQAPPPSMPVEPPAFKGTQLPENW